jgi:type I restriction-modification system DNA methylase subunit
MDASQYKDYVLTMLFVNYFSEKYLTEDPIKNKIRSNIDHICISNNILNQMKQYEVGAWNHFTQQGQYMSDHNGIYITFEM